ncbi:YitT family protein [Saccharicrinis sp. FJH2]|uniref:YitT family protein n=1 Tax=Saccharicrinis sp. FJH65 TaxID=3344659 RepID=UPI0035F416FE
MSRLMQTRLWPYISITFGLFIFSIGWTAFLIPSDITGGGIAGVGTIIYFSTGIPVALTYLLVNVLLLILAFKILGPGYGLKTIYGVAVLTGFLALFQHYIHEPAVQEPFMACVIGGILSGIGTGMVFSGGGSTGGTDIIASIYNKYRHTSPGKVILFCDVIIIGSSYFVFKKIETIVYGLTAMAIASYTIDLVISGVKQSVQFMIFSTKYEQIADRINADMNRGVTVIDATGWYSKEERKIVMVVVRKPEALEVFRIVKDIDPTAFISQGSVMGVFGEGFESIKA